MNREKNNKRNAKKILFTLFVLLSITNSFAQKRFKEIIFNQIDSITDIQYGAAINIKGENENLILDVITPPQSDTLKMRPLLIFIHGGGFKNNDRKVNLSKLICTSFAKRGYVTATIDYRLGIEHNGEIADYHEALYRAQQDGKAAVRFFRRYAEKYGIDTSQIFLTGTSAGSKTGLAIAYMDQKEIPSDIDQKKWGSLEGNSGNEGYSSKVHGVLNNWGALIDYKWIQKGDVPLFNIAGTMDKTVPYDSSYDYHSFKYGSIILYKHCLSLGIPTGWRPFIGAGHTLDNKKNLQDSAVKSMVDWLYTQLSIVKAKNINGMRFGNEINKFDTLNKIEHHTDSALLFLGSSYMKDWKNIRKDLNYPDIIHRGFGGSNLTEVIYYLKRIVYPHHPKAIFMYVGNDIVNSEKDKSPDQVLEMFKYTVEIIRQKYPTTPITWLQISPSEKRWGAWDKVQAANKLIEDYCNSSINVYSINFSKSFLGENGLPIKNLYRDDKLHYNDAGYVVWGNTIKEAVKKIAHAEIK